MITTLPFYTILITLLYYLIFFIFLSFFSPHFLSLSLFKSYQQLTNLSTKLSTYPHYLKHHSFFNFSLYFFYSPSLSLISFQKELSTTYQLIHKVIHLSTFSKTSQFFQFLPIFLLFLPIPPHFIFSINFFIFSLDNSPLLCYTLVSQLRNPTKH